jgi:hypothetical protein
MCSPRCFLTARPHAAPQDGVTVYVAAVPGCSATTSLVGKAAVTRTVGRTRCTRMHTDSCPQRVPEMHSVDQPTGSSPPAERAADLVVGGGPRGVVGLTV